MSGFLFQEISRSLNSTKFFRIPFSAEHLPDNCFCKFSDKKRPGGRQFSAVLSFITNEISFASGQKNLNN